MNCSLLQTISLFFELSLSLSLQSSLALQSSLSVLSVSHALFLTLFVCHSITLSTRLTLFISMSLSFYLFPLSLLLLSHTHTLFLSSRHPLTHSLDPTDSSLSLFLFPFPSFSFLRATRAFFASVFRGVLATTSAKHHYKPLTISKSRSLVEFG